ncbi:hypothetical protein [Polymorphospora sp. NPDC050346]|uniref:hypothetical protein n=1 Tax=Polymorphospora sp. NPDC050346 TaxID=3155780 RepID=UPI00340A93CB
MDKGLASLWTTAPNALDHQSSNCSTRRQGAGKRLTITARSGARITARGAAR